MKSSFAVLFCAALAAFPAAAQTPAKARITATVTAVDAAAKQVSVKPDTGDAMILAVPAGSYIKHLPPGETDSKKAVDVPLSDVGVGDRVVFTSKTATDGKTIEIGTMYVVTKADIGSIHDKELQDWKTRGTTGNLASADAASKSFTIKVGSKDWKVVTSDKTDYQRYSADSAKMSDAKTGAFADLKTGDEVHVLGDKSSDGTSIAAEKIVSGAFPQIAATIKSINPATNEIVVQDLATKKPVTIKINADSTLKKLPDMAAQMLARLYGAARGGQGDGAAAGGDASGRRGGGGGAGGGMGQGGPGGGGRGRGGRGGDVGAMLEQAPQIKIADLKPGDAIMVKTTLGGAGRSGTAVVLIAGVEPILTAAPNSTRDIMAGWNLGGGGGGEGN
jgi:hypothetical protein